MDLCSCFIGQNQLRVGGEYARFEQLLDLVIGLLLDPAVDELAGRLGGACEIDLTQPGTVIGLGESGP